MKACISPDKATLISVPVSGFHSGVRRIISNLLQF